MATTEQISILQQLLNELKREEALKNQAPIEPLREYMGYGITRLKTVVKFGCGEVSVRKADLQIVAENVETVKKYREVIIKYNAALNRLTHAWQNHDDRIQDKHVEDMGSTTLKRILGN